MTRRYFISALFVFLIVIPAIAQKQSEKKPKAKKEFKINTELARGHENNIFKSPSRYFDRTLNDYLPDNSLIKSDQFYDANLDIDYTSKLNKSTIDFSLDNWYRGYSNNNNLNQLKSRFKALYGYDLTEKTFAGADYQSAYSNKIAVSTTGEDLTRSFKYFENGGNLFIEHNFDKTNQVTLEYAFTYQKYLKEQLAYSLSNTEGKISLSYKKRINKNILYSSLSQANRKYLEYQAVDKTGRLQTQNPLRNFTYTDIGFRFRYHLSKSFTVIPQIDYLIRKDKYEDYYSYKKITIGSGIKYSYKKLRASANIDYKQINYDIKHAPSNSNSNPLKYKYINTKLNISYLTNNKLTAFIDFESGSRDTNTELEYYKTLRPYNQYEILLGIKYEIFK